MMSFCLEDNGNLMDRNLQYYILDSFIIYVNYYHLYVLNSMKFEIRTSFIILIIFNQL